MSLGTAIIAVENFLEKGVKDVEVVITSATAFIKKEQPEIQTILQDAIAAYKAAKAAQPIVTETIQALETLILALISL